jgi:cysteine desulfurase
MWAWLSAADPGRVHTEGRTARYALEEARELVAGLFGTRPRQVVFTSGGTEAVNAATYGALASRPGREALLAPVEHSAVREASQRWSSGCRWVGVDRSGRLDPAEVAAGVRDGQVGLVQCQLANHEVGTLQPVEEIASLCRQAGVLLHVDASAAAGHVNIDFDRLGADLLSLSAHRLGGPKGVGALLVRRGLRVPPLILGGAQERARRGGLENLPAAAGFGAVAAELAAPGALAAEAADAARRSARLRAAAGAIPGVVLYGPAAPGERLPNMVCMGIGDVEAEPVLIGLDQAGVAAHSGSSCSSESLEPSPVLEAMGVDGERSLRFSVGWSTIDSEVERAAAALPDVVGRLRELRAGTSPQP